jgi:hypothetical protein
VTTTTTTYEIAFYGIDIERCLDWNACQEDIDTVVLPDGPTSDLPMDRPWRMVLDVPPTDGWLDDMMETLGADRVKVEPTTITADGHYIDAA